jgi:hypothetical protein
MSVVNRVSRLRKRPVGPIEADVLSFRRGPRMREGKLKFRMDLRDGR